MLAASILINHRRRGNVDKMNELCPMHAARLTSPAGGGGGGGGAGWLLLAEVKECTGVVNRRTFRADV